MAPPAPAHRDGSGKSARRRMLRRAAPFLLAPAIALGAQAIAPALAAASNPACTPTLATQGIGGATDQLTFTNTTACDWTPPAGVTEMAALLVGGGGAGFADLGGYGGGGGQVTVDSISDLSDTLTVTVGEGSTGGGGGGGSSTIQQGLATYTAAGGQDGLLGGASGSGNPASSGDYYDGGGGGAGGGASGATGGQGTGLQYSSGLFFADFTCYGGGGAGGYYATPDSGATFYAEELGTAASCGGGGSYTDSTLALGATGATGASGGVLPTTVSVPPVANFGGGGGAIGSGDNVINAAQPGADGVVVIRYYLPATTDVAVTAASPRSITYGNAAPAVGYTTTPATTPSEWTVQPACAIYASTDTGFSSPLTGVLAAGSYVTHCSGGTSATYTPDSYINGTFTVSPAAAVHVTASNQSYSVGGTPPALTYTASGFVNHESFSSAGMTAPVCRAYAKTNTTFTSPLTLSSSTPAGTYVIHCSGAATTANYHSPVTYTNGTLTIAAPCKKKH